MLVHRPRPRTPLTLGVLELTEGHTLAGLNRLSDGIVSTFSLFAGAAAGAVLVGAVLDLEPADPVASKPAALSWLFVALLMLGLTVVFRVVLRDLSWCVVGGLVGYAGVTVGTLSRRLRPLTVALPGVLVPGAAAYLDVSNFEPDNPLTSLTAVISVGTQIVAIVAGLTVSTLFLPSNPAAGSPPTPGPTGHRPTPPIGE